MYTEIDKNMQHGLLRYAQAWFLRHARAYACGSTSEWSPVSFASPVMLRTDLVTIQGDSGSSG